MRVADDGRRRDFLRFWSGQAVSQLGSSFTQFATPLLVFKLTHSAVNLGVATAVNFLPYLLFGLIIGAWVDRVDRKRMMITVDLARAAVVAVIPLLSTLGTLQVWHVYAVGFVASLLTIFFDAGEFAAIPSLVGTDDLVRANGRIQAARSPAMTRLPLRDRRRVLACPAAPPVRSRSMTEPVTTEIRDGVAVIRFDDGKMNAITAKVLTLLHESLDHAERSAGAVCFVGNERAMSAGFDLAVMQSGDAGAVMKLVSDGARLIMRVYGHGQPTVAAVTGHALAAGALLVLACDARVVADRALKVGLNEVAIGLPMPVFAAELARDRLSKRFLTRAVIQAELTDGAGAVAAGYADIAVPPEECEARALAEAQRLAQLPAGAYAATKRTMRQATIDRALASL